MGGDSDTVYEAPKPTAEEIAAKKQAENDRLKAEQQRIANIRRSRSRPLLGGDTLIGG